MSYIYYFVNIFQITQKCLFYLLISFISILCKLGCWVSVKQCTDHPGSVGTYKETRVGPDVHVNETACLARAVDMWHYCGSHANEEVDAIYGPSGNACFIGYGYLLPIDLPAWLFTPIYAQYHAFRLTR